MFLENEIVPMNNISLILEYYRDTRDLKFIQNLSKLSLDIYFQSNHTSERHHIFSQNLKVMGSSGHL